MPSRIFAQDYPEKHDWVILIDSLSVVIDNVSNLVVMASLAYNLTITYSGALDLTGSCKGGGLSLAVWSSGNTFNTTC